MKVNHTIMALKWWVILFAAVSISACDNASTKAKVARKISHHVNVIKVTRKPIHARRIVIGSLEAQRSVRIFNEEQGKISALPFYPGDYIHKGTELVQLDKTIIQAQLDKAIAAYKQAQLDLKRIKRLIPRKLASEEQITRAKTALDQARAERDLFSSRLKRTSIVAPFSGYVSARNNEPGDVVSLHSHILTIIDPSELIAKIHISEILLANIKLDTKVKVRIDALGDNLHNGHVIRIYPTINPSTRQGTFEIKLDPIPEGALPGQLCRVIIETQTLPLRTIPLSVVRHDAKGEFVYRVIKGKAQRTTIKTGIQLGNSIEVIEGISDGDTVVSKGFLGLRSNLSVLIPGQKITSQKTKPNKTIQATQKNKP